jgi:GT2 family glycosyltransferase
MCVGKSALVSVIIVNWNGAAYLPACLTSLSKQTYAPIDILIVDNASTDDSCQAIETFQAQTSFKVTLIRNQHNAGFCRGNNQGIRASHGEFVLLLNADVTLAPPFLENLVHVMQADQRIGIATGKLLSGYDSTRIDSTGIVIYKNCRAVDRGQREEDVGQYNHQEEVFGASGAACLYRRTMLEAINYDHEYLDELFFAYKEDVDISWRARLLGWKCVYTPDAIGWHYRKWGTGKRQTIPKVVRRHSLKNRYLLLIKNERWETFAPHIGSIFWYELRSWLYILVREPYLCAVISDMIRAWPNIMQKRRMIRLKATQENADKIMTWFQ